MDRDDKTIEVSERMRAYAEKSVEQAQKALSDFMAAALKAAEKMDDHSHALRSNALLLNKRVMALANDNIAASLDLADRLVKAKTLDEIMQLQSHFMRTRLEALSEQSMAFARSTADAPVSGKAPRAAATEPAPTGSATPPKRSRAADASASKVASGGAPAAAAKPKSAAKGSGRSASKTASTPKKASAPRSTARKPAASKTPPTEGG